RPCCCSTSPPPGSTARPRPLCWRRPAGSWPAGPPCSSRTGRRCWPKWTGWYASSTAASPNWRRRHLFRGLRDRRGSSRSGPALRRRHDRAERGVDPGDRAERGALVTGRILRLARPYLLRLIAAGLLAAATDLAGLGLMATATWLLATAAGRPPLQALSVAIVTVRALAIARGGLRYVER